MSEPELDGTDIQADIVPGFRLPHLVFLGCAGETRAIQRIVLDLLPRVTPAADAMAYHARRIDLAKSLRVFGRSSFIRDANDRHLRWLNLALGQKPLDETGIDAPSRMDRSFELGLAARSLSLGDPRTPGTPGHKDGWIVGSAARPVDLLIILGSDNHDVLQEFAADVAKACTDRNGAITYREEGNRLDGDKEHFGFRDGISQPGVRGTVLPEGAVLTPRRLAPPEPGDDPELAAPGEILLWPGEFLFGHPRQDPNHHRRSLPVPGDGPFMKNGSYLVFRRLRQDVAGFHAATRAMAASLRGFSDFAHADDDWLRANLVGRWPSGAPLQSFPNGDPGDPPGSLSAFNHFRFQTETAPVTLLDGEPVRGVAGDPAGLVCPMHAHIRKVNPRDSGTNLGPASQTQQLRILRRGIPYGEPIANPAEDDGVDRGLLFVSFQRSIREQFEKLSQDWMNSDLKPEDDRGHDVLVGQAPAAPGGRRCTFMRTASGPFRQLSTMASWVLPTGGGYFFCPSISSLEVFAEADGTPLVSLDQEVNRMARIRPLLREALATLETARQGVGPQGFSQAMDLLAAQLDARTGEGTLPVVAQMKPIKPRRGETWPEYRERVDQKLRSANDVLTGGSGTPLYLANAIAGTIEPRRIVPLSDLDDVASFELDRVVNPTCMDDAVVDAGLATFRNHVGMLTGAGVRVAVLDSGVDVLHPFLKVDESVATCEESVEIPGEHGTHCAGSLASRDAVFPGIAPDIVLLNVKVLRHDGTGTSTFITKGIDAALDLDAQILSMSLGFNHLPVWSNGGHGWTCPDGHCELCTAVDNATFFGALVVVAAGNEHERADALRRFGHGGSFDTELGCPGHARGAITVGAVTKRTFLPADFSSRGPCAYGLEKPGIVGPGVNVFSTFPVPRLPNGTPERDPLRSRLFGRKSGTSMATPIVAGAAALIVQDRASKGLGTSVSSICRALHENAVTGLGLPGNVVGKGRIDLATYAIPPLTS